MSNDATPWELSDRCCKVALTDPDAALTLARSIADPWCRCQALAHVARYSRHTECVMLAMEALDAARSSGDPYQVAAASAWPLRALIERQHFDVIEHELYHTLETVNKIDHPGSRSEALLLLFQAIYPLGFEQRIRVASPLLKFTKQPLHWRHARALVDVVKMLANENLTAARDFAASIPDPKIREKALRRLQDGRRLEPRSFFFAR